MTDVCSVTLHLITDELQRNIERLTSELHATRLEVKQLSEELLALHEHADMETAQVGALTGPASQHKTPTSTINTDANIGLLQRAWKETATRR